VMAPLVALIVFLGVYPKPVLDRMEPSVDRLITHVDENSDFVSPELPEPPAEGEDTEAEGEEADDAPAPAESELP
jgi:NADH-quinone oxidoreductase subunit M